MNDPTAVARPKLDCCLVEIQVSDLKDRIDGNILERFDAMEFFPLFEKPSVRSIYSPIAGTIFHEIRCGTFGVGFKWLHEKVCHNRFGHCRARLKHG